MTKLTQRYKSWIFYNIKKFHTEDLYLRCLNHSVILSEFKILLTSANTMDELEEKLNADTFLATFKFYRKDGNYFIYPCLRDQVISLIQCWPEIRAVYKTIYDAEDDIFEFYDDEPFQDVKENPLKNIKRKTFGNKANISSGQRNIEKRSLHQHVMSSNRYVKSSFGFEQAAFKSRCLKEFERVEKRSKLNTYFLQTDLKSFYHSLNISTIKTILKDYQLDVTRSWLDQIADDFEDEGLPIGWILSGFVSDLVLYEFSKYVESVSLDISKHLKVTKLTMINYVDDMIFFFGSREVFKREEFLSSFCSAFQGLLDSFFKGSIIKIHDQFSPKTKFMHLRPESIAILRTNWHDFNFLVSGEEEGVTKKWTALDDFLLPTDNDLVMNEKVQFYHNLKMLKTQVENGEISTVDEFLPMLDKILYKMSVDRKYLSSIFDVVFQFLTKDGLGDVRSIITKVWDYLVELKDVNSLELINFLQGLMNHTRRQGKQQNLFNLIARRLLDFVSTQEKFKKSDDLKLVSSFFTTFYLQNPGFNYDLCSHASPFDPYFYKSSCSAINYLEVLLKKKKHSLYGNEYVSFEAIKSSFGEDGISRDGLIKRLDMICSRIEKVSEKRSFIERFFLNFGYLVLPTFDKEDLEVIVDYLKNNRISQQYLSELEFLRDNYDTLSEFYLASKGCSLRSFIDSLDIKKSNYRFSPVKNIDFKIMSSNSKPYLFYREVMTLILSSTTCYRDAVKVVLFQYRQIDSFVYFSWSCLPSFTSSVSHIALGAAKDLLSHQSKTLSAKTSISKRFDKKKYTLTLRNVVRDRLSCVDLQVFEDYVSGVDKMFERTPRIKIMIANVEVIASDDPVKSDFDKQNRNKLKRAAKVRIHYEVMKALRSAVNMKCDLICFPELTLPHDYLGTYLNFCGQNGLILIGGVEYFDLSSSVSANPTVISFPTDPKSNPLGKKHHTYVQYKNYLSIIEIKEFEKLKTKVSLAEGAEILLFQSLKINNFSVLTCSDFLSLEIKYQLQGLVQTLFVPAMNFDNTTYYHVAQSAMRELYCICVVCNNSYMGASHICAPYRDEWERTLFRIEGKSTPKSHAIVVDPSLILELQKIGEDKSECFQKNKTKLSSGQEIGYFKQVPPDWFSVRKKKIS